MPRSTAKKKTKQNLITNQLRVSTVMTVVTNNGCVSGTVLSVNYSLSDHHQLLPGSCKCDACLIAGNWWLGDLKPPSDSGPAQ